MPRLRGFAPIELRGPRPLPVVGVPLHALRLLGDPVGRLLALRRRYGELVANSDRSPALVCAFAAEHVREVLARPDLFEHDSEIPVKPPPGSALHSVTRGLVFQNGEAHRRHRKLMSAAFQRSAVEAYAPAIVATVEAALDTWPVGQVDDIAELTRRLVQDVAVRCFFGLAPGAAGHLLGRVAAELVDLVTSPATVMLPVDRPWMPYGRLLRASERLAGLLRELIADKRRSGADADDALARIVRAGDGEDASLDDDEVLSEAITLFFAGHDTQARALVWTLFLLDQHPQVLGALCDEVDSVLGDRTPRPELIGRMPLCDQAIKESLRLLPPAPVLFVRVTREATRLGPLELPAGASVVLSPLVTQRHPDRFPAPASFRPERWAGREPTLTEYLPFGAGPRMCIGAAFAGMALRLMLPMILRRYRLALAPGARVSRLVRGNILGPRYGMPMRVLAQDRRFRKGGPVRGDIAELVDLG